jgi:hypothetical protein
MLKHVLTVALVKSVLQVLDRMGPAGARHHQQRPRHHVDVEEDDTSSSNPESP